MQLSALKKGNISMASYFGKMRAIGDELAVAGRPVNDDEMVSFILSSVMSRVDAISLSDLYAQVMAYETRLEMLQDQYKKAEGQYQSSAK
jgi:hypothetical protein